MRVCDLFLLSLVVLIALIGLAMNKTRWKGQVLTIDRAKPSYMERLDPSRPVPKEVKAPLDSEVKEKDDVDIQDIGNQLKLSGDVSGDTEEEGGEKEEHGKFLGPSKRISSTVTLNQWIWAEDEYERKVRIARKQGWKLIRISKQPKVS